MVVQVDLSEGVQVDLSSGGNRFNLSDGGIASQWLYLMGSRRC